MDAFGSSYVIYKLGAAAVALVSWAGVKVRQARTKREMKEYAKESHAESMGKTLPDGFFLRGTGLQGAQIANVMKMPLHRTEIVMFTATFVIVEDKQTIVRNQTVAAFPNVHRLGSRQVPTATGDPNLYLEVAGEWIVTYYRDVVINKGELGAWSEKMYALAENLISKALAKQKAAS